MFSPIEKLSFTDFPLEIKELNDQFRDPINILDQNLKNFQEKMDDVKARLLKESSAQQNIQKKIQQALEATIGKTTTDLSNYISDKLTTADYDFLFNVYFAQKIVKVLEGILEFEKKIDGIFPDQSEKIMKVFENLIISLVVVQFPIMGLLIKTTTITDKIHNFFVKKNLSQIITEWNKQIEQIKKTTIEIENNKNLSQGFKVAKQIEKLAQCVNVNVADIINLGLKSESVNRVYEFVKSNIKEKDSLALLVNSIKQIPKNKKEIKQKLDEIKIGITEIITDPKAAIPEVKALQEKINKHLVEANKDFTSMLGFDKSLIEKLSLCQKAANSILAITDEIKKVVENIPGGGKIIKKVESFIDNKVIKSLLPAPLLMLKEYSPIILEVLGVTNALKIKLTAAFSKNISTKQGRAV